MSTHPHRRPTGAGRTAARATALVATTVVPLMLLTGCFALPGTDAGPAATSGPAAVGGDDSGAVGFDGVQSATLQIEAVGTFVDPSYGGYEAAGFGSGFLVSPDGIALTNNHVVTGAGTLKVWLGGDTSTTLNARVLGSSECLDLAAIQLQGDDFPYFAWADGDIVTAGDAYSAGFPLGDPVFTMTRGIVSKASTPADTPWASLDSVIEHDARIRSGNSGGPLVDPSGRLLGVNYAGSNLYDQNYAIHRDEVLSVIDELVAGENVLSLGINAQGLSDDEGNGLGIWVSSLASGGIADAAGLEPGDLITRMQGVSVGLDGTLADYCDVLRTHGQDASIDVEVYRPADGQYYRGQFNGDPLSAVSVLGSAGGASQATGEFTTITDDSGSVQVEVPAAWTQVDGSPFDDQRGNTYQSIVASPDLAAYTAGWSVPGVNVLASQSAVANTSPADLVAEMAAALPQHGCVSAGTDDYDDGYHVGIYEYWTDCGPEKAEFLVVGATSTANDYIVLVAVQAVSEADLDAIDRVLGSFIAEY
ncbi:S1C family serine protease [Herbiconiux moechotypicola]|uniref:PDZ domain-containing protein n=1 Tax=Herbiconiux moechotypicola TaxID=637393 RepID=A0ABP5R5J0_9MICO|nr:S1C family serine protease [Herbiconiux moechotypicola]MCS5732037.1 S1C family serine protease [Herbiconiux moechotypicola]